MSLNLSGYERKAVSKVLMDIARADGKISAGEVRYMSKLQDVLGLTDADLDGANGMSVMESLSVLRRMDDDKKTIFAVMMIEMIKADGDVDDEEMEVFMAVFAGAGIPVPEEMS